MRVIDLLGVVHLFPLPTLYIILQINLAFYFRFHYSKMPITLRSQDGVKNIVIQIATWFLRRSLLISSEILPFHLTNRSHITKGQPVATV